MGGPPLFLIVQREVRETSGHTPRLSMTVREHPRQPRSLTTLRITSSLGKVKRASEAVVQGAFSNDRIDRINRIAHTPPTPF